MFIHPGDVTSALAVAAEHGALVGHVDDQPVRIAPGDSRRRRCPVLGHGIFLTVSVGDLQPGGHRLFPECPEGLIAHDQGQVVG